MMTTEFTAEELALVESLSRAVDEDEADKWSHCETCRCQYRADMKPDVLSQCPRWSSCPLQELVPRPARRWGR